ncbi:hypothetical protein SAMN03080594_102555 [Arenibacter palladensis]|uniref:Uncharacterized protein n=1 Tax=Arenibacter palladensis TaxID=237373 RepID=A0A1M4YTP0_9FLAO|nr:hypothetical protein SAMN03080594_102555 [Arenibacter palladensis]
MNIVILYQKQCLFIVRAAKSLKFNPIKWTLWRYRNNLTYLMRINYRNLMIIAPINSQIEQKIMV